MKNKLIFLFFFLFSSFLFAQASSNYQIKEYVFNNGSNPAPEISSANFKITLSSIGDCLFETSMNSPNYSIDTGFTASYPPPQEVINFK